MMQNWDEYVRMAGAALTGRRELAQVNLAEVKRSGRER